MNNIFYLRKRWNGRLWYEWLFLHVRSFVSWLADCLLVGILSIKYMNEWLWLWDCWLVSSVRFESILLRFWDSVSVWDWALERSLRLNRAKLALSSIWFYILCILPPTHLIILLTYLNKKHINTHCTIFYCIQNINT